MSPTFLVSRIPPAIQALKWCLLGGTFLFVIAIGAPEAHAQVAPVLSPVSIHSSNAHPSVAKQGDTITLTFTSSQPLDAAPTVTIAGDAATTALDQSSLFGTSTVVLSGSEPQGPVAFSISDFTTSTSSITTAGATTTATTDGSSVNFDGTVPTLSSAKITGGNQITLFFSEPVLSTTADFMNFTVSPSDVRTITSVTGSSTDTLVLSFTGTSTPTNATGTLAIASTLTDLVGNPFVATTTIVADGQPTLAPGTPTTATSTIGTSLEQSGFAIFVPVSGTGATVGDTVELLLNGSSFGSPVMRQIISPFDLIAGEVTLGVTHGQLGADGVKNITADIIDAAGNISAQSVALPVTLDTVAPTLSFAKVTGGNQATLVFSEPVLATTTDFSNLSVAGTSRAITGVSGSGSSTIVLTFDGASASTAATGTVTILTSVTDVARNAFASSTATLSDGQAPIASLAYSKDPAKQGDTETVTATISEALASAPSISLSGANTASGAMTQIDPTHFSFTYTVGAGNGTTTATFTGGADAAGNALASTPTAGASFVIDNTLPTGSVSVSNPSVKAGSSQTILVTTTKSIATSTPIQIAVGGSDTLVSTAAVRIDATHYTLTYTVTGAGNGTATVSFTGGADLVGNTIVGAPTSGATFAVDNTAPTATVSPSHNPVRAGTSETLSITASEAMATTTPLVVTLSGANATTGPAFAIDPTHFTFTYTVGAGTGTTTVSLGGGTDLAGNPIASAPTSGAQFFVDNAGPTFTMPANITMEATGTSTPVTLGSVTNLSDNTDAHPIVSNNAPAGFPVGITNVIWTATDALGNTSTSSQIVHITDTTAPSITPPPTQTFESTSFFTVPTLTPASSTDIADPAPTVLPSITTFTLGTTTVTWTATDASGNSAATTSLVVIRDTTPPLTVTPPVQTFEATGPTTVPALQNPPAIDNSGLPIVFSHTPTSFGLGTTTVTWTLTDTSGNSTTTAGQIVIVDTLPPLISPLGSILLEATGPGGSVGTYATPVALDTVSGQVPVSCSPASGSVFALGTTTITCTATDGAGNTASSTAFVHVVDTTAPTITTPTNITTEATGPGGANVTFPTPTAIDTVSGTTTVSCVPPSGNLFPLGTTTPVCSTADTAGNTASTTFQVGVVDTTPPVIALHAAVIAEATSPAGTPVTYTLPTAFDIVDATTTVSCNPAPGSLFAIGSTTVSCASTDAAGNTSHSSFQVTVQDTTSPTLTAPATQVFEATGVTTTPALAVAAAIDAADPSPIVTPSVTSFSLGTTTVTWTATDASGNSTTTTSLVVIVDTTGPVITVPPTQTFTATGTSTTPMLIPATATDLTDPSPAVSYAPTSFGLGTTTVTWTATDSHGNVSTATSQVVIHDTGAPLIAPSSNITAEAASAAGATVTYATPTAFDTVDGTTTVACAPASGSFFSIGTTTVSCSSSDSNGNIGTSTFNVFVVDTTAPNLIAPATQIFEATGTTTTPALVLATSTDLVDPNPSITYGPVSFGLGTTTVTWTATDSSGNSTTTTSLVVIRDTTAPVIAPISNIVIGAASNAGTNVTYQTPAATDIVDGTDAVTCAPASGSLFAMGTTPVICSATDTAGNATSTQFTVTVTTQFPIAPSVTLSPTAPTVVVSGPTAATSTITIPASLTSPMLDLTGIVVPNGNSTSATIGGALIADMATGAGTLSLDLPQGLTITGPAGWSGSFELPTFDQVAPAGPVAPNGFFSTISSVVEVGDPNLPLSLSHAARLLIPGEAGKSAGYVRLTTPFTNITTVCLADNQASADAQLGTTAPAECVMDVGSDLVIWTNHFTTFVTYQNHPLPAPGVSSSPINGAPTGFITGSSGNWAPAFIVPTITLPSVPSLPQIGANTPATSTLPVYLPSPATTTPVMATSSVSAVTTTPSVPRKPSVPQKPKVATSTPIIIPVKPVGPVLHLGAGEVIPPAPTHLDVPAPIAGKSVVKKTIWLPITDQVAAPSAISLMNKSVASGTERAVQQTGSAIKSGVGATFRVLGTWLHSLLP